MLTEIGLTYLIEDGLSHFTGTYRGGSTALSHLAMGVNPSRYPHGLRINSMFHGPSDMVRTSLET
jgi:hypothetical protein